MTANATTITRQLLQGSLVVIICEASVIAQTNTGVLSQAWQDNSTNEAITNALSDLSEEE